MATTKNRGAAQAASTNSTEQLSPEQQAIRDALEFNEEDESQRGDTAAELETEEEIAARGTSTGEQTDELSELETEFDDELRNPQPAPVKDSEGYSEYKLLRGSYTRKEGGTRVRYDAGDRLQLTRGQARLLRGSVRKV